MEQEKILGYALGLVRDKLALWFPEDETAVYGGALREALLIAVTGLDEDGMTNPMETLRIGELLVPAPRMVYLRLAAVPCFSDPVKALDRAALIKRNIHDAPTVELKECLWHGCGDSRVIMEFCEASSPLPVGLAAFEPYRWDFSLRLGINSAREEQVVKVRERQFTAVSK